MDNFTIFEQGNLTNEEINEIQKVTRANAARLLKQIELFQKTGKVKIVNLDKKGANK